MVRTTQHYAERSTVLTADQAQLAYERQRLGDAQTKLAQARDESTRFFYRCAVAGWERSIKVLEREIDEHSRASFRHHPVIE